jgi:hypothetical protein
MSKKKTSYGFQSAEMFGVFTAITYFAVLLLNKNKNLCIHYLFSSLSLSFEKRFNGPTSNNFFNCKVFVLVVLGVVGVEFELLGIFGEGTPLLEYCSISAFCSALGNPCVSFSAIQ